jgi:hypothetical protein
MPFDFKNMVQLTRNALPSLKNQTRWSMAGYWSNHPVDPHASFWVATIEPQAHVQFATFSITSRDSLDP